MTKFLVPDDGGNYVKWTHPGDNVQGAWLGVREGEKGKLGAVKTADESEKVFSLPTDLERRMAHVKIGAHCDIVFTDETPTKRGRPFKHFSVALDDEADYIRNPPNPDAAVDANDDDKLTF